MSTTKVRGRPGVLTDAQREEIAALLKQHADTHPKRIAARYNVSLSTVYGTRSERASARRVATRGK